MSFEQQAIKSVRENRRLSQRGSDLFDREQLLQFGKSSSQRAPRKASDRPYQLSYGSSHDLSMAITGWSLAIMVVGVILMFLF